MIAFHFQVSSYLFFYVNFSAIHCPPYYSDGTAILSSYSTVYGSLVNLTCVEGYTLGQGQGQEQVLYDSMTCQANSTWSLGSDVCQSKFDVPARYSKTVALIYRN